MKTSRTIHSFLLSQQEGQTLLTAQEYPWSVLQVIPTTPINFERTVAVLEQRGFVAHHDIDRTFCIIHRFNSIKVRLIHSPSAQIARLRAAFQFHKGSINTYLLANTLTN